MPEARTDPETGEWSVIAPRRAGRPVDSRPVDGSGGPAGSSPPCPFCPGNEAMTPPEVLRVPAEPSTAGAWGVRVFPNLFALVGTDGASAPALPFTGQHEVLVESPRHDWDLRFADPDEAATVLYAMRQRCRELGERRPAAISIFRNYGARAGASLAHPHSQLVALDQAPPGLVRRWQRARDHFEQTGRRLHDDLAAAERREGTRVVSDSGGVLVWQPYAASVPHETVLLPDFSSASDLASASDDALAAVARVLPRVLAGLAAVLDDPAYNLVVHSGPANDPTARDWYRWHISLYPRVTTPGGLEIATGVSVNPTTPEDTAAALRSAVPG